MASTAKLTFLLVIVAVCFLQASARADEKNDENKESRIQEEVLKKEKFFVASHFTTTFTALSTFISAAPYFCLLTADTAPCQGRTRSRRRRLANPSSQLKIDSALELEASGDLDGVVPEAHDADSKNEKFFFTVWKTTTTTATITSMSTNFSVTISVSARCSFNNIGTVPVCG